MNALGGVQAGFSNLEELLQIDRSLKTIYAGIENEKAKATESAYWFQRAWRGFISSGQDENSLRRFCVKSLSVASVITAPIFAATTFWGAYEISALLVQTMLYDPDDSQNNYTTAGHIPEWIVGGMVSLYVAIRSIQRAINEENYQAAVGIYKKCIADPSRNKAQVRRIQQLAEADLKEIEHNCLFDRPKLSVLLNLFEGV